MIQPAALRSLCKRLIDVLGSVVLLVIFLPALAVIALLVKLHDAGPLIYRLRVLGPEGAFEAFKFRSMRVDADAVLAASPELRKAFETNFKLERDPRVTRVGRLLRRFSLDELPQLFNVLRGEMSLIGPRTITVAELAKYGQYAPKLLTVKPGLSGYWQVHGRQTVSYAERVRMDMFYIDHWSLRLDLLILLKTPVSVILGRGAY